MKSLKIFFSYGHDSNDFIVDKIKNVLTGIGHNHQVWIDKEQIRHSSDWREKIVNGINNSDEVVAFLSSYALNKRENPKTKSPEDGVCRDELSIAVSIEGKRIITILLESEKKIDIPTTISGIQWLDMSDWRDKYDIDGEENGPVFSAYFNDKITQILEVIETPENFKTEGEIRALRMSLMPSMSNAKYGYRLKKEMVGRRWLSKEFDSYIDTISNKRFLYISGGPGFGKSHFITHAIHYRPEVIAGYFFDWSFQTENSMNDFICDIAFQIASRLPMFRENLVRRLEEHGLYISDDSEKKYALEMEKNRNFFRSKTPAGLFAFLISDLLSRSIDGEIGNRLIVIDGLDEAEFCGNNPLIDFLCDEIINALPNWCKFVITSRNEEKIEQSLKILPMRKISLDCEKSNEDISDYLHYRLDSSIEKNLLPYNIVDIVVSRCEKTFIYAEMLCNAYEEDPTILANPESIPNNIAGLYTSYFRRLFLNEDYQNVKKVLEIISACGGKINKTVLMSIMNWDPGQLNLFTFRMKSFINKSEGNYGQVIVFYHKTISEWLLDPDASGIYTISRNNGEENIAEYCSNIVSMVTPQNTSFGFDGRRYPAKFVIMKFAYENTIKFGSSVAKREMMFNIPFLYTLQLQSYIESELNLSYEIADQIKNNYCLMPNCHKEAAFKYFIASKNAIGEIEIAKEKLDDALTIFYDIEKDYKKILKEKYIALYRIVECNICFCLRRTNLEAAEIRLSDLFEYIKDSEFDDREKAMANLNYHRCVILYDKACKYFAQNDNDNAESTCLEAINRGEEAIKISGFWFEDNSGLKLLCINQIGSCYFKLSEIYKKTNTEKVLSCLEHQLRYKNESLSLRLKKYGKFNRFTANAYDYQARALLDLCRWKKENVLPECLESVKMATKIAEYVLGKKSALYARTLQTKIYILEYQNNYSEALPLAQEQYDIYSNLSNPIASDINKSKALLDRIKAKVQSQVE